MVKGISVKDVARALDDAYEAECRNRPPYLGCLLVISGIIAWTIVVLIVCNSKTGK